MKLKWLGYAAIVLVWVVSVGYVLAQSTNSGDIRGTVTDTTGAVLPDVTVTVLNIGTGVSKDYTTNGDGLYDTASIVAGTYKLTFTKDGFSSFVRSSITLQVGLTTINAELKPGSVTDQVVVNTDIPLLQTENAEQSTTLEYKSMSQLPNVGQDWQNFTSLLPGSAGAPSQPLGVLGSGQSVSTNGNLPYSSVLADGATTTLPGSSNSDVSIFETVQEVQISTSAVSAQYGIGGVIFNQISKGGTSSFHGAAYEYFQNDALNAAPYAFGASSKVPFQRFNNFGGSIGGPILKKKMFFYFNYDKTLEHGGSTTGFKTVPTAAMLAGDFTGQPLIYDPATTTTTVGPNGNPIVHRVSFADEYHNGNRIPASRIDAVARAVQAYYPTPNVPGTVTNGQTQNNYFYNVPSSNPYQKFFGRLDYDITPTNRLTLSDTQRDNPAFFANEGTCPVNCQTGDVDSNNAQISDVWTISSNTINEARLGYTWQGNFFQPASLNQGFPAKLGWQFAKADIFPDIKVTGAICCYELQPNTNAVYKEHGFDPSDVVTMIRGKHILHFGGELLFYRDDATAWGNTVGGQMTYNGIYTQSTQADNASGVAYADFLLGQTQSWNANNTPEFGARLKSPQVFIQDDYKVRPNLTLNLGLRYQIQTGWSEVKGNEAVFDPTVPNTLSGNMGAFWYGSTHANGRTTLQSPVYNTFLPRVGFAYLPHPDTTIRAGFGIYAYNWSLDTYGGGMGGAFGSRGSLSDPTGGISPVVVLSSSGSALPYNAATTDPTAYNGQNVTYNQYHTPVPKSYQWNLSVQHQIGTDMSIEMAYVASHGSNLAFPISINQVPESRLSANDSGSRPYPQYGDINGSTNNAISNYHSLQASVQKRFTHGLNFNFNYTWSHFLDDQDSSGWGNRGGTQIYQRAYDPHANYGPSNFDIRHAFKGSAVYELPFGKNRMFFNKNWLLDETIGGWQASGTVVVQTGNPFTPYIGGGDTSNSLDTNGNFHLYPNVIGTPQLGNRSINQWFNEAAYAAPAPSTFGNAHRNTLVGPGLSNVNFSLGKSFAIWEQVQLQIRADANNIFNHPSFGTPNVKLGVCPSFDPANPAQQLPTGCSAFGAIATGSSSITSVTIGGRTMQLGARLSF